MPVPVTHKCKKCGGESDDPNMNCLYCDYKKFMQDKGVKHPMCDNKK